MAGQKILTHNGSGGFTEVVTPQAGGSGSENKVPSLDANGRFPMTMMPTGIGADASTMTAAGAIAAGDFVNVFDDTGTPKIRKADASALSTMAHGFVLASIADTETGTVYWEGSNTEVTGLTAGNHFLSETAGDATATAPTTSGAIVQSLGVATSATSINFEPQTPVLLA